MYQSVNILRIYIYIAPRMHLCILSWSGYSTRWFFTFDFRFEKEKKKKASLDLAFSQIFLFFDEQLWRFADEREKFVFDEKKKKRYVSNTFFDSILISL